MRHVQSVRRLRLPGHLVRNLFRLRLPALGSLTILVLLFCKPAVAQKEEISGLEAAMAIEQVLVDLIARAEKSIVAIARVRVSRPAPDRPLRDDTFDRFRAPLGSSDPTDPNFIPHQYGTGVVVDPGGLILTQYHVVQAGDEHWVTTSDRKVYRARIKAADPRSGLAVLAIDAAGLVPVHFGEAEKLRKGQIVVALGNPYAIARDGQVSASWGIVANLARKAGPVPVAGRSAGRKNTLHHFGTLIQTDAKLNMGTSGGALMNLRGEMIGITTAMAATAGYEMSAGYAVPIDAVIRRVIEVLKDGREVEYGLLGVVPVNLSRADLQLGRRGVRVDRVYGGTPADQVGLEPGDLIMAVDGRAIHDADGLMLQVGKLPADTRVRLTVYQGTRIRQIHARLAKYYVEGRKIVTNRPADWRGLRVEYSTAMSAEEYLRRSQQGEIDPKGCVAIASVEEDSPTWRSGLRPKMFISHVGRTRIRTPGEFRTAIGVQRGSVRVRLTLPEEQRPLRTIQPAG